MQNLSGWCKVRWKRQGTGKSGGVRVIYFVKNQEEEVVLLTLYAKAKTDNLPASPAAVGSAMTLTSAYDFAKGDVAVAEAYATDGAEFTPAQALYMIWGLLAEKNIAGTTMTIKKLDGSTSAMTFTLNDATTPTAITRAT